MVNSFCFGQNRTIDSLITLLKNDKADTSKVIHLYQLTHECELIGKYDKGLNFGVEALGLARNLNFKKGIANACGVIGNIYCNQADYPQALDYYLKALEIDEGLKNKKGIANRLGNIGTVYKKQGCYPKALDFYLKALKIAEEIGNKNFVAAILGNIGNVCADQGDYSKTLDYYFKALKFDEELGNKNGVARHLGNIGNIYQLQKDYLKALGYYFKGVKMDEELGDKNGIAIDLDNIGGIYQIQKKYPQSLDYYFKAMKMAKDLGDKQLYANTLSNIGSLYTTTGKFTEAEQYLKRANDIDERIGEEYGLRESEEFLSKLYETTGRQKDALIHYKKAITLKDTIFSQENKKQLVRKEMNYEFDKKEAITKAENDKQQAVAEEKNRKQKIITGSVTGGLLLVIFFAGFVFRSLRITRKQKQTIEIKNIETEHQKKIIEEANKDITDSIRYAKRIQDALMGEKVHVSMHLPEHFILFIPKDIVSGDFHWGFEKQGHWYFAAVDCTGHGVPGAVMSMLGISFLNDIVSAEQLLSPAEMLNRLRDKVVKELRQTGESGGSKDGMDISLCRLNLESNELMWAGANNALNIITNGQFKELKADKQPIGYHPEMRPFTNHEIQLQKGDSIYIYSDGYADQFGGANGKKFKYKQLEELLIANKHLSMNDQKELLKKRFVEWKGSLEQIDDVCVFGVRI